MPGSSPGMTMKRSIRWSRHAGAPAIRRRPRLDLRHQPGFPLTAIGCLVFLYGPISLLMLYSFNAGDSLTAFSGLSLRWYRDALSNQAVKTAALTSLQLAVLAAALSTA